ncbi:MAG TPA: hypothetical protein PKH58_03530 [Paludibacteraceae bacterium]|nr:hypothetical protein [Paludibacteraceae bacterium]
MSAPIFNKENYLIKAEHYPATNYREKIILQQIELIDKPDIRLEGLYYLILWDLFLIGDREDASYKERLRLARLLKFLYSEEGGVILTGKDNPDNTSEISKKQIPEFQEVVKKQLSETFLMVRLNEKSEFHFPRKTWSCENASQWPPDKRKIEVLETTTFAMNYMKKNKSIKIVIDRENIDLIISMEAERELDEKKTYVGRFLSFINKYAIKYGYFSQIKNSISIQDALFLYETLELLEIIQPDILHDEQEKYLFIKRELKNGNDF